MVVVLAPCQHPPGSQEYSYAPINSCLVPRSGFLLLLTPSQTPGVVSSPHCLPPRPQEWSSAPTAAHLNSRSGYKMPPLPSHALGAGLNHPLPQKPPGSGISHCICTPSIKRIMTSTCWGKRQQASILKTALTPRILNPHKLHGDDPKYK